MSSASIPSFPNSYASSEADISRISSVEINRVTFPETPLTPSYPSAPPPTPRSHRSIRVKASSKSLATKARGSLHRACKTTITVLFGTPRLTQAKKDHAQLLLSRNFELVGSQNVRRSLLFNTENHLNPSLPVCRAADRFANQYHGRRYHRLRTESQSTAMYFYGFEPDQSTSSVGKESATRS